MKVRMPACANQFYPGDPRMLKQTVLQHLASVNFSENVRAYANSRTIKGIIVPHGGYMYSGSVAAHGHKLLGFLPKDREWKILIIGVSHNVPFSGASVASDSSWKMPFSDVRAKDLRDEIGVDKSDEEIFIDIPEAHKDEHSIEVQIPFLQIVLDGKFILYPLVTGSVRADLLADKLVDFAKRDDVIVIVSSDLSHHLSNEEASRVDGETMQDITDMNIDRVIERGEACGRNGILAMMFLAEKLGWKPIALSYKNSGDAASDRKAVTGYGSVAFFV